MLSKCFPYVLAASIAGSFGLNGCSKPKTEQQSKTESSASTTASAPAVKSELTQRLQALVDNCNFNLEHAVINRCTGKEKRKLVREFRSGKRSRIKALPDLLAALQADDPKLHIAAARVLHGGFRQSLGEVKAGAVDKKTATAFIELIPKLERPLASATIGSVVHVAMLAGEHKALYAMLDAHKSRQLRAAAYGQLMVHGGIAALPKVKELLASDDANLAAAAIRNGRLLPKSERVAGKPICTLAIDYLADKRPLVALRAGQIAANCGDEAIDALLSDLEIRHQAEDIHTGLPRSVERMCGEKTSEAGPDQCTRLRAWLVSVIGESGHADQVRAGCMIQLATQFPDPKSERLIKRYEKDSSKKLRSFAAKALRRIQWKQGKLKTPVDTAAAASAKKAKIKLLASGGKAALVKPPVVKKPSAAAKKPVAPAPAKPATPAP